MADKRKRAKKNRSGALRAAVIAAVCVAGLYVVAGLYFSWHFLPGTLLNNTDVSLMSKAQAESALVSAGQSYNLTLLESDYTTETISGSDISLEVKASENFNSTVKTEAGFLWLPRLFSEKSRVLEDGVITYNYDDSKLEAVVSELKCLSPEYPVKSADAQIVLMNGEFKIIEESVSNIAHKDRLTKSIKAAIEAQKISIDLYSEGVYDTPKICADDEEIIAKKAFCDELIDVKLILQFGMSEELVDIQTLIDWVKPVKKGEDFVLAADSVQVKKYVKYLSEKYDTVGKTKIFATHSGSVVELTTGDYGWKLNEDTAEEKLTQLVLAEKSATVNLTDKSEESSEWWEKMAVGYDSNGNDYYGTTYAEVSIPEQHMWLYKDGTVVLETDVVTGNPNYGNDTPVGAFRIRFQQKNAILRGPGYVQPVSYWMVFADDVGFHDAEWQSSFGGDAYLTRGSHGCVNMPIEEAAELYDLIYTDMPVFVY